MWLHSSINSSNRSSLILVFSTKRLAKKGLFRYTKNTKLIVLKRNQARKWLLSAAKGINFLSLFLNYKAKSLIPTLHSKQMCFDGR